MEHYGSISSYKTGKLTSLNKIIKVKCLFLLYNPFTFSVKSDKEELPIKLIALFTTLKGFSRIQRVFQFNFSVCYNDCDSLASYLSCFIGRAIQIYSNCPFQPALYLDGMNIKLFVLIG